ncbi:MAG: rod shape-determining protein MreC [Eubacterium sp.]|nr:rod shape-determining protein MreC [Eubacterium sp.]
MLVILTIICVCLIGLTVTSTIPIDPIRDTVGTLIIPLQNGLNRAGSWISGRRSTQKTAEELQIENDELREKVANLQEQNTILTENTAELEDLRELYALDREYAYYDKVAADVIANDTGNWYNLFTINKGENDGIHENMNVLSNGGLVGIVTKTGPTWAQVRSIIDDGSHVSSMVLLAASNCIVSGDLGLMEEGKLRLSDLPIDAQVSTGEKVVTSNISDKYLPGILIGYVDEVQEDQNHLMQEGTVLPAADFSRIDHVLVILETKSIGGES